MSKFIELMIVEYPNAGYSGGYDDPKMHNELINVSYIECVKKCIDIKLKDTNSFIKLKDDVNWKKCNETYTEIKEKLYE